MTTPDEWEKDRQEFLRRLEDAKDRRQALEVGVAFWLVLSAATGAGA